MKDRLSPYLYLSNAWLNGEDIDLAEAARRYELFKKTYLTAEDQ